jgi:CDP-diacylglycerol---serine O-phosphatidyltransferase
MSATSRLFPALALFDIANVITVCNAGLSIVTVASALSGHLAISATVLVCAALLDYLDGHVARTYLAPGTPARALGMQLDTLADLSNFSLAPATVVIFLTQMSALGMLVAGGFLLSGVIRLAFFNAITINGKSGYVGLPTTYAGFGIANVLLLIATRRCSMNVLLGLVAALAIAQIVNFQVKKPAAATVVPVMSLLYALNLFLVLCFNSGGLL